MFLQSCQSMCLKWFRKVVCSIPARGVHLYHEVLFPSSFILKRPDLSVSSCGLRPPVFVLFWKSKVFSPLFLFISYSHSTTVRQTWWLRHWPFTYQNISLLSHFLEGKWKVFCSSGGQRCCFMYGCEDFWSRARHTCWVGGEKWRDVNFWNSPVCWRKIAHINVHPVCSCRGNKKKLELDADLHKYANTVDVSAQEKNMFWITLLCLHMFIE